MYFLLPVSLSRSSGTLSFPRLLPCPSPGGQVASPDQRVPMEGRQGRGVAVSILGGPLPWGPRSVPSVEWVLTRHWVSDLMPGLFQTHRTHGTS